MGCSGSKQARRRGRSLSPCVHCHSLPAHRRSGVAALSRSGDDQRSVSLTSSTLGDINTDDNAIILKSINHLSAAAAEASVVKELGRTLAWSVTEELRMPKTPMITPPDDRRMPKTPTMTLPDGRRMPKTPTVTPLDDRRIPMTPSMTPPDEPEVINTWELMAGLEDTSPLHLSHAAVVVSSETSQEVRSSSSDSGLSSPTSSPTPQWLQRRLVDSVVVSDFDFDPELLSTFRKALIGPSPQHQPHSALQPLPEPDNEAEDENKMPYSNVSVVQARISEFQQKINAKKTITDADPTTVASPGKCPPGGEGKVVVYFTTLRGIRKVFEDCWAVRMILKGYGVCIDERDVSMHSGFKEELVEILGPGYGGGTLPRVFADGNYLGGAEEVRQLHELGRLGKFLECCEMVPPGKGIGNPACDPCEACGDIRFVVCETCSGSCKVYVIEEEEEENGEEEFYGVFRRCTDCNENGLVRCPLCC